MIRRHDPLLTTSVHFPPAQNGLQETILTVAVAINGTRFYNSLRITQYLQIACFVREKQNHQQHMRIGLVDFKRHSIQRYHTDGTKQSEQFSSGNKTIRSCHHIAILPALANPYNSNDILHGAASKHKKFQQKYKRHQTGRVYKWREWPEDLWSGSTGFEGC